MMGVRATEFPYEAQNRHWRVPCAYDAHGKPGAGRVLRLRVTCSGSGAGRGAKPLTDGVRPRLAGAADVYHRGPGEPDGCSPG
eukprot:CAMPEP_0119428582 /NCGR_PEP_ID=MMETSP1335-20130426/40734_1 /TAXON_ID=259385 /ORGANISM="Chrysoculter rhomboideus, Strain RCC1486" /LENGTH=82 /DNA_ID=CAMNT_0007454271 /DNA_START=46 /DNA_END=289 /DNA_ORIENTATION=+